MRRLLAFYVVCVKLAQIRGVAARAAFGAGVSNLVSTNVHFFPRPDAKAASTGKFRPLHEFPTT
jgi:hypothetical protein